MNGGVFSEESFINDLKGSLLVGRTWLLIKKSWLRICGFCLPMNTIEKNFGLKRAWLINLTVTELKGLRIESLIICLIGITVLNLKIYS